MRILLIEDEAVIRGAVTQLLERQGYRVSAAGSLEEADAATGFRGCDLIIADLRLPGLPGTEAIARANDSVYGLSAYVFTRDQARGRRVARAWSGVSW